MLRTRVIPCLQLINESLVKTLRFGNHGYIGDPINTVRIFNELEVDELCFLDIRATVEKRQPNFKILAEIANECFMPLSYGGGVKDADTAKRILSIGFEKIVINSEAYVQPKLITDIANYSGNQSVVGSIDVRKNLFGKYVIYTNDGKTKQSKDPVQWAKEMEDLGAGELLLTSMDRDGTWVGYDIELFTRITSAVNIPVIANGGAGSVNHISEVVKQCNVSAVGLGSMVVYQAEGLGVLINFPDKDKLSTALNQ
jgi:imidazole glycerol-phosphate synthase subunit HisF